MAEAIECARHRNVQTTLRCGRCDTPICPQCLVHAAVGIRCPDCGRPQRLPTYDVSPGRLTLAVVVSLATGIVGGVGTAIVAVIFAYSGVPFGFLAPLAAFAGLGLLVGELTSRASNRKQGGQLKIVALLGVLAALIVEITLEPALIRALAPDFGGGSVLLSGIYGIGAVVVSFYVSTRRF